MAVIVIVQFRERGPGQECFLLAGPRRVIVQECLHSLEGFFTYEPVCLLRPRVDYDDCFALLGDGLGLLGGQFDTHGLASKVSGILSRFRFRFTANSSKEQISGSRPKMDEAAEFWTRYDKGEIKKQRCGSGSTVLL